MVFRKPLILLACLSLAHTQDPNIDPLLEGIFGTPDNPTNPSGAVTSAPSTDRSNNWDLETYTVQPTTKPLVSTNEAGESCTCVPYYLCNKDNVGVDINNASVTGWGELDIRFGTEDNKPQRTCQESVEICCTTPKETTEKPVIISKPLRGCGYRNPRGLSVTVTGGSGKEAQYGEFPWVVAIQDATNDAYLGVGVIIHPQVILTGAHIAAKSRNIKITAGEWDTQTIQELFDVQLRDVEEVYIHRDFKPKSLKNDVALLRLRVPLALAEHINMLCLPSPDDNFDNARNCVANGWGSDVFGATGRYAVILKKVEQDMVPRATCQALLRRTRLGYNFNLHESFVCAGGREGQDTCKGDGGAPLACPVGDSRYKLSGLVAWGIGCGEKDVPGVYVNAPHFRRWVDEAMDRWGYGQATYTV